MTRFVRSLLKCSVGFKSVETILVVTIFCYNPQSINIWKFSQYADDVGKYNDLKKGEVFLKTALGLRNLCLCFMSKAQKTLLYYILSFLWLDGQYTI